MDAEATAKGASARHINKFLIVCIMVKSRCQGQGCNLIRAASHSYK
jgi:hypothetical protein